MQIPKNQNEVAEQPLDGKTINPSMEDLLKRLNYQPHGLTADELEKPIEGIANFFGYFSLATTRASILDFYKGWVYTNSDCTNEELTKNMLFFFSELDKLVNVAFVAAYQDTNNPFWIGDVDETAEELPL